MVPSTAPGGQERNPLLGARDQLVSITRLTVDEGPARGSAILAVRNPAGVSFDLLLDRAMDIGWADALGIPLAWRAPRGFVNSSRYEPQLAGWVHTFGGGLLTTCGLRSTGPPSVTDGIAHPLHGRIGHLPADHVTWRFIIDDDGETPAVEITGDVTEAALGQSTLVLHRRIVAGTSAPWLRVEDSVMNESWAPAGHMFRHHFNLGAPLVVPGTTVDAQVEVVEERETPGTSRHTLPWRLDLAPEPIPEVVLHCLPTTAECEVEVRSPAGYWLRIGQKTPTWDHLILWRDASPGVNVLGVEPSTSRDFGREAAEAEGEVWWLKPGEERCYVTTVTVGRGDGPRSAGWQG